MSLLSSSPPPTFLLYSPPTDYPLLKPSRPQKRVANPAPTAPTSTAAGPDHTLHGTSIAEATLNPEPVLFFEMLDAVGGACPVAVVLPPVELVVPPAVELVLVPLPVELAVPLPIVELPAAPVLLPAEEPSVMVELSPPVPPAPVVAPPAAWPGAPSVELVPESAEGGSWASGGASAPAPPAPPVASGAVASFVASAL